MCVYICVCITVCTHIYICVCVYNSLCSNYYNIVYQTSIKIKNVRFIYILEITMV